MVCEGKQCLRLSLSEKSCTQLYILKKNDFRSMWQSSAFTMIMKWKCYLLSFHRWLNLFSSVLEVYQYFVSSFSAATPTPGTVKSSYSQICTGTGLLDETDCGTSYFSLPNQSKLKVLPSTALCVCCCWSLVLHLANVVCGGWRINYQHNTYTLVLQSYTLHNQRLVFFDDELPD